MAHEPRNLNPDFVHYIKVGFLLIGGGIGLAGMVTERSTLVWLGIVLVGAGLVTRLVVARMNRRTRLH